jgi:hypothetical protein
MKFLILLFIILNTLVLKPVAAQDLKPFDKDEITVDGDWLIDPVDAKAALYKTAEGKFVFSNGIVARTFVVNPNCATVGLDHLVNNEAFLRSVRPEAEVKIDGLTFNVGGLTGQPIHNYLSEKWIKNLKTDPAAFKMTGYKLEETKERFAWEKRLEWMPKDLPWPPPGKELIFSYQLDDAALNIVVANSFTDSNRPVLLKDEFKTLSGDWKIYASEADERNSFINEGKAGEIMALANNAVFADRKIGKGAQVFLAKINPGTDNSSSWGPGMGLVFGDKIVKINLRPGNKQFGFYDGESEKRSKGMRPGEAVWLRLEIKGDKITGQYSYDKTGWNEIGQTTTNETPEWVRVGKMDWRGDNSDNRNNGERGRCHIEEFQMLGAIPENVKSSGVEKYRYLENVVVNVHYELYDNLPLFCKWITIDNNSEQEIQVNKFKSEILAAVEPRNEQQYKGAWMLPNITIQTDYDCGGGMQYENGEGKAYEWEIDPLYKTQINWPRENPCLLVVRPEYGPEQPVASKESFDSHRVWELIHSSRERERKGLEMRRMFRTIAPWATENPVMMHARFAEPEAVKSVVDQCAEVGFEKVILTFGSGFNIEDDSEENISRMKMLADYAHSKNITLGGYSLLASRKIGGGNDVVMPEGMSPQFGNSPCICSNWGEEYFGKLYNFLEKTGFDNFEHDGSYPGDVCASTEHPGHKGLEDSRWNQFKVISDFYHWCRGKGIFLNIPDWYFLNGGNKVGMGYRETNWSLPRAQQEIIERQNIYDGTWFKTPSMGWMHVPLVQYHGGGAAATLEPLHEHLDSYGQRLANLFGAGVQAAWRGKELYDTDETKALVKKWVDFYNKHRRILDGDIIHVRRPDGNDYDAILHIDPTGTEKGLLMVYNPLNEPIKRKIKVNLYYTGLKDEAKIAEQDGIQKTIKIDRNNIAWFDVEIPAHSQTWFVIKSN